MCIAYFYSIVVSHILLETKRERGEAFIDKMIAATSNCINNKSSISISKSQCNQFIVMAVRTIVYRIHMTLKISTITDFVCLCIHGSRFHMRTVTKYYVDMGSRQ